MTQAMPFPPFSAHSDRAEEDGFAITALRIVLFTGFAVLATILGFVFLPLAGAAIAIFMAVKGFDMIGLSHRNIALRVLSILAMLGFASLATILAFVFLPLAGAVVAGVFLIRGLSRFGQGQIGWSKPHSGQWADHTHLAEPNVAPDTPEPSSGNAAFDAYRADMLRRLDQERTQFQGFLSRLRDAKDRGEFDDYLTDQAAQRSRQADHPAPDSPATSDQRA